MASYQNSDPESANLLPVEGKEEVSTPFLSTNGKIALALSTVSLLTVGVMVGPFATTELGVTKLWSGSGGGRYNLWNTRTGNNENNNQLIYLDRFRLDCGYNPIKRFQMANEGGRPYYNIQCLQAIEGGVPRAGSYNRDNGFQEDHNLIYYDRQRIGCDAGGYITKIWGRNNHGNFGYGITCERFEQDPAQMSCSDHYTNYNEATDKSIIYLDRHNVECPTDKGLNFFEGQSSGGQIRYHFKCCDIQPRAPTAAPIATPTAQPVADPTLAPTDVPTLEPVANPTLEPTVSPTMEPTKPAPMTCALQFTDDVGTYESDLADGCVLLSNKDVSNAENRPAAGVMACGSQEMNNAKLSELGLVSKENSLSYVFESGESTKFTYFTGNDMDGTSNVFHAGEISFIHHHNADGQSANDATKSLSIEAPDYNGGAKC